jgi:hypothetical protein
MSFTSEVIARLRLDTGPFARALTSSVAAVGKAGEDMSKKLKRSFGAGDAFKGLLQGIGIGSVSAISEAVVRPFQAAAEQAKTMMQLTSRLREITTKEIIAINPAQQIRELQREFKDLNVDIEMTEKLVKELDTPLALVNGPTADMLREAREDLAKLKERQAEVASQINVTTTLHNRQIDAMARALILADDLVEAELRDAGEREKLQIRLNALQKEYNILKKQGASAITLGQNYTQQRDIMNQMRLLEDRTKDQRGESLVSLGELATKKPEGRGRSETERIAARGAKFRERAEEAILKGDKAGARRNAMLATRDLTNAGARVAAAGSAVRKEDQKSLGSELVKANKTLSDINKNLTPGSTTSAKK